MVAEPPELIGSPGKIADEGQMRKGKDGTGAERNAKVIKIRIGLYSGLERGSITF